MTALVSKTVRANLEANANDRHLLAQELSATIRVLDRAERRERANATTVPYLAAAILQLDQAAKDIAAWRPKHSEPVDPYLVSEHAALSAVLKDKIRWYLTHFADVEFTKLGPTAWARRVVKKITADKALDEARRAARASGKPVPPKSTVRAVQKSQATSHCTSCGKARERSTQGGMCEPCVDKFLDERGVSRRSR